jgi:hypothetical protein
LETTERLVMRDEMTSGEAGVGSAAAARWERRREEELLLELLLPLPLAPGVW